MKINNYYKEEQYIHYSNCHEDSAFVLLEREEKSPVRAARAHCGRPYRDIKGFASA